MANSESPAAPFEYIFEQRVPKANVERYFTLSEKLHGLASQQPGFVHQERRKVADDGEIVRFETTLKFDTAEHLISWLDHPERRRMLNLEEDLAGFAFKGHGNWDGYSRWLSRSVSKPAPKWKVNLLVLLTLYPTAMLLTPLLHITLKGFGLPGVMLISNILCVAATSWILVPFVSHFYAQWLEGNLKPLPRALALASLLFLLALLFGIFQNLPADFWG